MQRREGVFVDHVIVSWTCVCMFISEFVCYTCVCVLDVCLCVRRVFVC